jgi:hypothetical protein
MARTMAPIQPAHLSPMSCSKLWEGWRAAAAFSSSGGGMLSRPSMASVGSLGVDGPRKHGTPGTNSPAGSTSCVAGLSTGSTVGISSPSPLPLSPRGRGRGEGAAASALPSALRNAGSGFTGVDVSLSGWGSSVSFFRSCSFASSRAWRSSMACSRFKRAARSGRISSGMAWDPLERVTTGRLPWAHFPGH